MVPKLGFDQRVTGNCRRGTSPMRRRSRPKPAFLDVGRELHAKGTYYSIFVVVVRSQPTGLRVDRNLGGLAALRTDRFEISSFANHLHI